jgi:hypothetical protein
MELVSVSNVNGVTSGVFRLKNGKEVSLDSTKLAPNDARKLVEWKPVKPATKATFIGAAKGEKIFENSPAEDSASFRFSYIGQNVIGVKKNSLRITSCSFTGERKVRAAPELSTLTLGSPLPIISEPHNGFSDGKTAWDLSPTLTFNDEFNQNELNLLIQLKHENDYPEEEVTNSKLGASLIVGIKVSHQSVCPEWRLVWADFVDFERRKAGSGTVRERDQTTFPDRLFVSQNPRNRPKLSAIRGSPKNRPSEVLF